MSGNQSNPQGDAAKLSLFPPLSEQPSGAAPSPSSNNAKPNSTFSFPPTGSQPAVPTNFGSFGQASTSGPSTTASAAPSTSASAGGLFSNLGNATASTAPSTTASAGGLFLNLGNDKDKAPATTEQNASTTAPSTSAPAPSVNIFGGLGKPTTSTGTSQPTTQAPTTSTSADKATSNTNLGASISGPPPTAQSRLKNKSMDEIITRWASDLSKYQKEFQKQAERVAAWDRMLVDNSEKIQKLYGSTLEAERATTEVERQLTVVENNQREIETWLDHYEQDLDRLTSEQLGRGESFQGADQEREQT